MTSTWTSRLRRCLLSFVVGAAPPAMYLSCDPYAGFDFFRFDEDEYYGDDYYDPYYVDVGYSDWWDDCYYECW